MFWFVADVLVWIETCQCQKNTDFTGFLKDAPRLLFDRIASIALFTGPVILQSHSLATPGQPATLLQDVFRSGFRQCFRK